MKQVTIACHRKRGQTLQFPWAPGLDVIHRNISSSALVLVVAVLRGGKSLRQARKTPRISNTIMISNIATIVAAR